MHLLKFWSAFSGYESEINRNEPGTGAKSICTEARGVILLRVRKEDLMDKGPGLELEVLV